MAAYGLYTHIAANKTRSMILLAGLFLLVYVIGHLLSAILIGVMLGRLHIIPVWAAWAFALTSPLTIAIFPIHNGVVQDVLKYLICVLWIIGAIPAAVAMLKGRG